MTVFTSHLALILKAKQTLINNSSPFIMQNSSPVLATLLWNVQGEVEFG